MASREKAAATVAEPDWPRLVDELGALEQKIQCDQALLAPSLKRASELRSQIQKRFETAPAELPQVLEGKEFLVELTAKEFQRKITNKKRAFALLKKYAKLDELIAVITIPLKEAVDKFIPAAEHPEFLTKERTGSRDLKVLRKAA